jgi:hypothetical protein
MVDVINIWRGVWVGVYGNKSSKRSKIKRT